MAMFIVNRTIVRRVIIKLKCKGDAKEMESLLPECFIHQSFL